MFSHGFCLLWNDTIILWSIITNGLIALTYYLIPIVLYTVAVATNFKIPKNYKNTLLAFAAFIFFCGTGHLLDILLIWVPWYWFKIYWDGATAISNIVALIFLSPVAKRFVDIIRIETSDKAI